MYENDETVPRESIQVTKEQLALIFYVIGAIMLSVGLGFFYGSVAIGFTVAGICVTGIGLILYLLIL